MVAAVNSVIKSNETKIIIRPKAIHQGGGDNVLYVWGRDSSFLLLLLIIIMLFYQTRKNKTNK